MTTIRLLDARRGLNLKCRELFRDEKISDAIYRYLCDGIEECEDAEPKRKTGKWEWLSCTYDRTPCEKRFRCSECHHETIVIGMSAPWDKYCPNCGTDMRGEQDVLNKC